MENLLFISLLVSVTACVISVWAAYRTMDNDSNIALRSVKKLAERLGYEIGNWEIIKESEVFPIYGNGDIFSLKEEMRNDIIDLLESGKFEAKIRKDFFLLLNHLGLEIFEGRELRKKK